MHVSKNRGKVYPQVDLSISKPQLVFCKKKGMVMLSKEYSLGDKSISRMERQIREHCETIDVVLNGARPWDLTIHDKRVYKRIMSDLSLGFGESYMDGWWDCARLDEFFMHFTRHIDVKSFYNKLVLIKFYLKHILKNQQSKLRSKRVAQVHYNLGNDLYESMLGKTMAYTCGYWRSSKTLDEAQYAKYDLVCQKLHLQPGENVLELGCGWGGFAYHAAKNYGVRMTSVNIAQEQMAYAKILCRDLPVNLVVSDYRDSASYNPQHQQFDKVVSVGMCEHVGHKNYRQFFSIAAKQLKSEGLFLMHTIGKNSSDKFTDPWIQKYIFPGGMLPSIKLLAQAVEGLFVIEDIHNFGADYDKTLMAWYDNFKCAWPTLKEKYGERFYRMWRFYLLGCAGAFRSRSIDLWQFVFSPKGVLDGYQSIR